MPVTEKNTKMVQAARTFRPVTMSETNELPTRIEIMHAGEWPDDSNKGHLEITVENLHQFVRNFDNGIGMPGGAGFGLPIDFAHDNRGKAAGWIKSVIVEGDRLYANVQWSSAGTAALKGGEFKCFSPSFFPSCLGMWHDPEDWANTAQNVLVGGALTNIPFLKGLKPIMASASSENDADGRNVIYVEASEKKGNVMTLDDVRVKDAATLSAEDKAILVEANDKKQLTADEQKKFGFEVTADNNDGKDKKDTPEVNASQNPNNGGQIDAAAFNAMQTTVEELKKITADQGKALADYQKKEAETIVQKHVDRGAIKLDQKDTWVGIISDNKTMETALDNLPGHVVMDAKIGDKGEENLDTAKAKVEAAAKVKMDEAKKNGVTMDIGTAYSKVMAEQPELAAQYETEIKE